MGEVVTGDFRVGSWLVKPSLNVISRNGRTVRLEPKVMDVLVCLAGHAGETLSKEKLLQTVWPDTFVSDDVLKHCISELRRVFEDDARESRVIQTIAKRGYRFIGSVNADPERGSEKIRSVAVLPLENLSGDPEQEYFADGMTEVLITSLAKIGALHVVSRTTAMHYKKIRRPLPDIARELQVDGVVEGTVLRSAERVRISVQLIDARSDAHLWAETYERDAGDVLALQSELAQAIAREIRVVVTPREQLHLAHLSCIDRHAYEAYLKGRYHWSKGSRDSLNRAVRYFNDCIGLDGCYAPAHSGLAEAFSDLAVFNFVPPTEAFPQAKCAAMRAIELDPELADAHAAIASVAWAYEWDWPGAEKQYAKAFQLKSASPGTHSRYALYLINIGRVDEAFAEARQGHELDPLSPVTTATVGWVYLLARNYNEALAWYNRSLELEPYSGALTRADIAWTHVLRGAQGEAISEYEKLSPRPTAGQNQAIAAGLGFLLAVCGRRGEALDVIAQLELLSETNYVDGGLIAAVYAGLGDEDHALDWLKHAYASRSSSMAFIRVNPFFDTIRSDPRFQDLLQQMKFPM